MVTNITIQRSVLSNRFLWHTLFAVCVVYNFHRYVFKYSHGAYPKEGYQQTPLTWQAGKFFLVATILCIIYLRSKFVDKIPINLLIFYSYIFVVFATNVGSALIYGEFLTDELEYVIFSVCLLPVSFFTEDSLNEIKGVVDSALNTTQYLLIASNWIVIFNFLVFRIVPFHAYEGILMRFGGLWDDPNTLAIFSVFLLGYSILKKQYLFSVIHTINILLTVSLTGYILLFALVAYLLLNTNKYKVLKLALLLISIGLFFLLIFININFIVSLYEAKRESIEQHATVDLKFMPFPLMQPVQFHETWLLSINVNYFPFSVLITVIMFVLFVRFFIFERKSLQRLLFILFFISNLFLPFLYMFPINFFAILFLVLYAKGIRF